ncbi:MAG TPA: TrmH family RNA methyltransferase, partial [Cyclobacteriaceae bacterium]|nr:TrmH family RNA methyltransferase [Cyclobacteriaceae bacterium]
DVIKKLQRESWKIIALEQANHSIPLHRFNVETGKKHALVFGNEVFGVEEEVLLASDEVVEIPQIGTKHSFNISVSIGICLWDFVNKMGIFASEEG